MCCRCYPKLSIGMTRPFESHSGICAAVYLLYFPNRWFAAPIFTPISIILGQEGQLLRLSDVDVQRQKTQKSITRSSESVWDGNWRSRIETVESKLNEVQVPYVFFATETLQDFGRFVVWETSSLEMIWRVSSDSCATWKRLWMRISCRQGWCWACSWLPAALVSYMYVGMSATQQWPLSTQADRRLGDLYTSLASIEDLWVSTITPSDCMVSMFKCHSSLLPGATARQRQEAHQWCWWTKGSLWGLAESAYGAPGRGPKWQCEDFNGFYFGKVCKLLRSRFARSQWKIRICLWQVWNH